MWLILQVMRSTRWVTQFQKRSTHKKYFQIFGDPFAGDGSSVFGYGDFDDMVAWKIREEVDGW